MNDTRGFRARSGRRRHRSPGLSAIELVLVLALLGVIAALATPVLLEQLERLKVKRAIADLVVIEFEIRRWDELQSLPATLDDLEPRPRIDPWGRPYVYFKFEGAGWKGKARKDRFLVPINTSFDLYSLGRDGESRPPLQNPRSFDDVIRANDGAFYGLGRDF